MLNADPLAPVAWRIARQPRFDEAARHYVAAILGWREGPRLLNKLSSSHARSQIVGNILFLDFDEDPQAADSGATYLRLLAMVERRKDCSRRVLATVIALLRLAKFVEVEVGQNDRRRRVFRPTKKMVDFVRQWYAQTFGCFDILVPGHGYSARVLDDEDFLRQVIVAIGRPYHDLDIKLVAYFPDLFAIFGLDAGFTTAASLVLCDLEGVAFPKPNAIAKRFGSSVSQVRNILKALVAFDLIELSHDGMVMDASRLSLRLKEHIARELSLYATYALNWDGRDSSSNETATLAALIPSAA